MFEAALYRSLDWMIRIKVARDPSTSPYILAKLANDEDIGIREIVASNRKTPAKL